MSRLLVFIEAIAAWTLFALMALVCSSIVSRWLLNLPFSDWFDLSRLLLGIAVFWGIAAACGRDDHIRGDLVWDHLPPRLQPWVDAIGRLLILTFIAALIWKLYGKVLDVRSTGQETSELRIKIWPFYGLAWLATLLTAAILIAQLALGMRRFQERTTADAAPAGEAKI